MQPIIWSLGHSTRPFEAFTGILKLNRVECVVDVRRIPRSRHNPHFNGDRIRDGLSGEGIEYVHFPALGGFRRAAVDSVNTGLKNKSFRGYADYMRTAQFRESLGNLLELARQRSVCLVCAEAVPWRCHRSLIADVLVARGMEVVHLIGLHERIPHNLTNGAKIEGEHVYYP